MQNICFVPLLVHDYDEAIAYFTAKLGFTLVSDEQLASGKRWVLVAPPGARETRILLSKATSPAQTERVGSQMAEKVCLYLHTTNFQKDFEAFRARGVEFVEEPRDEAYGTVAVFRDLYGNRWDLLQLNPEHHRHLAEAK